MAAPTSVATTAVKRLLYASNKKPQAIVTESVIPATLFSLPSELHLLIASHLPLSARLALTRTCNHFRQLLYRYGQLCVLYAFALLVPGPVQHFTQTLQPAFASDAHELEEERQRFLSYVERDELAKELFGRKEIMVIRLFKATKRDGRKNRDLEIWCSYCQDYHRADMFTMGMLKGWRHERKCRGAEGKLWVCPHRVIEHQSVQDFTCGVMPACRDRDHDVDVYLTGVMISRKVMVLGPGWESYRKLRPSYDDLRATMKARKVRICPHLRMSDRAVYGAAAGEKDVVSRSCRSLVEKGFGVVESKTVSWLMALEEKLASVGNHWKPLVSKGRYRCAYCDTSWDFMRADMNIWLVIYRPFIHSHGVCHPAWYNQVALPDEFEGLEQEWKVDADNGGPPIWLGKPIAV